MEEWIRTEKLPYLVRVFPIGNGRVAEDSEHFENRGTEIWASVRDWLTENLSQYIQGAEATVQFPDDDELITQLTSKKYRVTGKSRIMLERMQSR